MYIYTYDRDISALNESRKRRRPKFAKSETLLDAKREVRALSLSLAT